MPRFIRIGFSVPSTEKLCIDTVANSGWYTQKISRSVSSFSSGMATTGYRRWAFPSWSVVTFLGDRKSTRLNSSHLGISYAVFCLKKNNPYTQPATEIRRYQTLDRHCRPPDHR